MGAKTIELIHEYVHIDAVRDDLDTLVMDAELLEAVLGNPDPDKKAKEISVKLTGRLRKHAGNQKPLCWRWHLRRLRTCAGPRARATILLLREQRRLVCSSAKRFDALAAPCPLRLRTAPGEQHCFFPIEI
ncbi:MAG: hypothetical protein JJT95_06455 [Pararhodobacter sp.]|nr:hypothetical protein [Pararhodobacter sp.]